MGTASVTQGENLTKKGQNNWGVLSIDCYHSKEKKKQLTQSNEHHDEKIQFKSVNQKAKLRKWDMKWTIEWGKGTFNLVILFLGSQIGFNLSFLACLHFGHNNAAICRCCYILCISLKLCCIADNLFHSNTDTCTLFHIFAFTQTQTDHSHSIIFTVLLARSRSPFS